MAFSQWLETWSAGGCLRRCTGAVEPEPGWDRAEQITDGPCVCDLEGGERQCDYHTRLSVMLADLHGVGVWRLDSQGWNAAVELAGIVESITAAAGRGIMLPAVLHLEQRMANRPGEPVRRFAVPRLDTEVTPRQLLAGLAPANNNRELPAPAHVLTGVEQLPPGGTEPAGSGNPYTTEERDADTEPPIVEPVPPDDQPRAGIAAQVGAVEAGRARPAPRKRGKAPAVPRTGAKPRTAAQAAEAAPEPERRAPARKAASAPARPPDEPPEPVPVRAEAVDPKGQDDSPPTKEQNRAMHRLFTAAGLTDRDDRLIFCSEVFGRRLGTGNDMTGNEASSLITRMTNWEQDGTLSETIDATIAAAVQRMADEDQEGNDDGS
jgi:hypothetical protein